MDRLLWERTAELFALAIEWPEPDRESFVRRAAGADVDLRDAVLRLLRYDASEQLLDRSVEDLVATLLDESDDEEAALGAGDRVGDYEIVGVLGRGGMGVVYQARDTRLDRLAALKFLPASAVAPRGMARVEVEARAASALDHPNIATIYHVGSSDDGRPYIAMAYYEGQTLAERLRSGPLPPREAVRVAAAVAAGLAAAHERGIVHRDVKPANVFLTSTGQVKLLDFGIAAAVGTAHQGPAHGTPLYMSPEQSRAAAPHPQSDVWSLGTMLYEMLAGSPPFAADSPAALRALKAGELPPLPLRPGLTIPLRAIVTRALSRDPARRFPDAGAMQRELDRLVDVATAPLWSRMSTPARIGIAAAAIGVIALTLRSLVGGAAGGGSTPVPSPSVLAVFPFTVRGDSANVYLREGMVDLLRAAFDGVSGVRMVDARAIRRGIGSADSLVRDAARGAEIATRLGAGRFILGEIVGEGGRLRATATLYTHLGRAERMADAQVTSADKIFDVVDQLANRLLGSQSGRSGANMLRLAATTTSSFPALKSFLDGERALRSGAFEDASVAFSKAVAIDTNFALAYYGLANAEWWADRSERAQRPAARALRAAASLPRSTRLLLEGLLERLNGDLDAAESIYRQLITLAPDEPDAWFGLGDVLFHYNAFRGRSPQEARPYFEHALGLQPDNMTVRLHLANIAARRREYERHDSLLVGLPQSTEFARFVRMVNIFAGSDSAAQMRAAGEFGRVPARRVGEALHYVVRLSHNPRGALLLAAALEHPGRSVSDRATARVYRAGLHLTLGRWNAAVRDLIAADAMGDDAALPMLALWSLAPFVPPDSSRWRDLLNRLSLQQGTESQRKRSDYLRGLLSVRLGDTISAVGLAERLESVPDDAADPPGRRLALAIRAELALRRGAHADALRLLEQIGPSRGIDLLQDPLLNQSHERFLRAELLRLAGRNDEALAWYEGLIDGPTLESIHVAPAYYRSARLLRVAGDSIAAADFERWFSEVWEDADAAVRAWTVKDGAEALDLATMSRP